MAFAYARGNVWWIAYQVDGKRAAKPTEFKVSDPSGKRNATRLAKRKQQQVDAQRAIGGAAPTGEMTVRAYVAGWLVQRREAGHDYKADRGRLDLHVLPVIGDMKIAEVRTKHIADLVHRLRFKSDPKLAPRTVRNIYTVVAALFRDAAIAGVVDATPCILTTEQLGPVVDSDPEWRDGALFTRDEAEIMISDARIPLDRQLVYGFGLLAGLRPGEASALRFRHYDPSAEPLGRLTVAKSYNAKRHILKGTKTDAVKIIPVHPTLAAMLAEWKLSGWEKMMRRAPTDDDLIVPLPPATIARRTKRLGDPYRGYNYSSRRWREIDLPMLGWRERSLYDCRATFITLACDEDGADRDVIRDRVTHTKSKRNAFDGYARGKRWVETCTELSKLNIRRSPRRLAIVASIDER